MRAVRRNELIYGAICAAVPMLWGLAVYRILRGRPERRPAIPAHHRPDAARAAAWDHSI